MWIWQRKEIYIGYSIQDFSRIRDVLAANNIRYDYKVKNRQQPGYNRGQLVGRWGTDSSADNMYYIYVKKEDYEQAKTFTRNIKD